MQENVPCLIREVERVVTTPYAPALNTWVQKLEAIVENIPNVALRQWADCKPCQVLLLAAVIIEQMPYSLKLLTKFGWWPRLLEHIDACISMLSSCAPEDVAIPARIPAFLTNLLHRMVQEPGVKTIRPLYEVMDGLLGNSNILKIIPNDLMASFQHESTNILRNLNDPMGSLLCLATFTRIRKLWLQNANNCDNRVWLENICHIFGSKRVSKTLDLVVISSIMACSDTCNGYSSEERLLIVRLSIEICENIDEDLKKSWLSTGSPKIVKLCDKLRRPDIDSSLQMMGLTFVITFLERLSLPSEIYNTGRERLFAEGGFIILNQMSETTKYTLLRRVLAHFDENELCNLLSSSISTLAPGRMVEVADMAMLRVNILAFTAIRESDHHLSAVTSYLKRLPVADEKILKAYMICVARNADLRKLLFIEILHCFQAISNVGGATSLPVPSQSHDLVMSFLMCLKVGDGRSPLCRFSQNKHLERLTSIIQNQTKDGSAVSSNGASHEWRSKLAASLLESAQNSHESIIQQMEAVCKDFEERCSTIKKPLAEVIQERDQIRRNLEHARQVNMELEGRALQDSQLVSSLTNDRDQLAESNRSYTLKLEGMAEKIDVLQNEIDSVREQSSNSVEAERIKARSRELDLMATVAERDDFLEEQEAQMDSLKRENLTLKEKLEKTSQQNLEISQKCDGLREEVVKTRKEAADEYDSHRLKISQFEQIMHMRDLVYEEKDARVLALSDANRDLSLQLHFIQGRARSDDESLRSDFEEERQRHKSTMLEMESKHATQMAQAHSDANQEADRYRLEITTLRNNAEKFSAKTEIDFRAKEKKIRYLEKKVEFLHSECSAKARDFSEAQEHIGRLMNVIGFKESKVDDKKEAGTENTTKEFRQSSRLVDLQTQSFLLPSQGEITTVTQFSNVTPVVQTSNSFQQNARSRSRRVSNAGYVDPNRSFSPNTKESTVRDREPLRRALSDVDRNSPSKSQRGSPKATQDNECRELDQKTQSQVNLDATEWGNIDLDFDDDDLFTSTMAK
ncbi:hypothetical protein BGW36DRAFT_404049 [Talaromyces proteolyticus]|uniref:Uncharacterized protein n=1 Tax=Talaromyces proteolyticus TaxID=1131652 RepID=A0AAD4KY67_9EURO|nr:uncharacterized protein BGW36DRAFT_404049 [Talaromyces proteolyticus]KAH8703721.1 hypothetical protein BGW36DRAFT_404049 [Talaromyces proteolyticus]